MKIKIKNKNAIRFEDRTPEKKFWCCCFPYVQRHEDQINILVNEKVIDCITFSIYNDSQMQNFLDMIGDKEDLEIVYTIQQHYKKKQTYLYLMKDDEFIGFCSLLSITN